jgi:hypothetical protein
LPQRQQAAVALPILVAALIAAACGGHAPLTPQQCQAALDRVSKAEATALSALNRSGSTSLHDEARIVQQEAGIFASAAVELRNVSLPEDARAAHALLIRSDEETADELRRLASAAKARNKATVRVLKAELGDGTLPGLRDAVQAGRELAAAGFHFGP